MKIKLTDRSIEFYLSKNPENRRITYKALILWPEELLVAGERLSDGYCSIVEGNRGDDPGRMFYMPEYRADEHSLIESRPHEFRLKVNVPPNTFTELLHYDESKVDVELLFDAHTEPDKFDPEGLVIQPPDGTEQLWLHPTDDKPLVADNVDLWLIPRKAVIDNDEGGDDNDDIDLQKYLQSVIVELRKQQKLITSILWALIIIGALILTKLY